MSKTRTVPGENLTARLSARLASRAKVGQSSEFFHRFGIESPYDAESPAQEMAENGMFSYLSASAYYRELRSTRHRMMWRIDSIRHRPVAGERLRKAGPAFARPERKSVLAGPTLHDWVFVDHDEANQSDEADQEEGSPVAAASKPRRKYVSAFAPRPLERVAEKHIRPTRDPLDKRLDEVVSVLRASVRGDTRRALEQAVRGSGAQRDRALARVVRDIRGPVAKATSRQLDTLRGEADQTPVAVAKARMGGTRRSRGAGRTVKGLRPVLRNSPALVALQPEQSQDEVVAPVSTVVPGRRARSNARPVAKKAVSARRAPATVVARPEQPATRAAAVEPQTRAVPSSRATATSTTFRTSRRAASAVRPRPTAWAASLVRPSARHVDVSTERGMVAASPSRGQQLTNAPLPRAARRSLAGTNTARSAAPLSSAATQWLTESLHPERAAQSSRVVAKTVAPMRSAKRRTARLAGQMELSVPAPSVAAEPEVSGVSSVPARRKVVAAPVTAARTYAMRAVQSREVAPTLRAADRARPTAATSLSASPVRALRPLAAVSAAPRAVSNRAIHTVKHAPVRSKLVQRGSDSVVLSPNMTKPVSPDAVASVSTKAARRTPSRPTVRAARRADPVPGTDVRGVAAARPNVTAHVDEVVPTPVRAGAVRRPLQALLRQTPEAQATLPLAAVVARSESARPALEPRAQRASRRVEQRVSAAVPSVVGASRVDMVTVDSPRVGAEEAPTPLASRASVVSKRVVAREQRVSAAASSSVMPLPMGAATLAQTEAPVPATRRASQRLAAGLATERRVQAMPSPAGFVHAVRAEQVLEQQHSPKSVSRASTPGRHRPLPRVQARGTSTLRVDHRDRARLVAAPTDYLRVAQAAATSSPQRSSVRASRGASARPRRGIAPVGRTATVARPSALSAPTARLIQQLEHAAVDLHRDDQHAIRPKRRGQPMVESVLPVERLVSRQQRVHSHRPDAVSQAAFASPVEALASEAVEQQPVATRSTAQTRRTARPAQGLTHTLRQVAASFRASERADVQVLTIDAARRSVRDAPRGASPTIRAVLQTDARGQIVQGRATHLATGQRTGAVALAPGRSWVSGVAAATQVDGGVSSTSRRVPQRRVVAAAWAERRASVVPSTSQSAQVSPGSRLVHRAVSPLAMTLPMIQVEPDGSTPALQGTARVRSGAVSAAVARLTAPFRPSAPLRSSAPSNQPMVLRANAPGEHGPVSGVARHRQSPVARLERGVPRPSRRGGLPMAQPIGLSAAHVDSYEDDYDYDEGPAYERRPTRAAPIGSTVRTGGNLLTALARAADPDQVVQVILQRSRDLGGLADTLGGAGVQLARSIASTAHAEMQTVERPQQTNLGPRRRGLRGAGRARRASSAHRTPSMSTVAQSTSAQGVGSSSVMKLANKLMKLIHLAEHNRRDEARSQVRMAEDTASARAEGGVGRAGSDALGEGNMSIEALKEQVLQEVQHQMELMNQRQGDPDVGNGWW